MDSPSLARRAADRWFLDRGLPSVVTRRARLRAVWPRSAPVLAGYATISACFFVIYLLAGPADINNTGAPTPVERLILVIILLAVPLAALIGWIVARILTDRAQTIVSTAAVALVTLVWFVEKVRRSEALVSVIIGALWPVSAIVLVLALTASGIGSVLGWAVRLELSQLAAGGTWVIRSLPVMLLTVLVFFNTYVWVMVADITASRLWLALWFLVVLAGVFVVSGTLERARPVLQKSTESRRHAERLTGTPFEEMTAPRTVDALTPGERFNVVFVLAASQIAQIMTVAVVTAAIFFVLGLIVLSPALLSAWTRTGSPNGTIFGMTIPVPQALIQMTLFLGALTFMYVSAQSVGDGEYRSRFLDPLIDDLKLTLLARNRYRHSSLGKSEPVAAPDPP